GQAAFWRMNWVRAGVVAVVLLVLIFSYSNLTFLGKSPPVTLKLPWEYRFVPDDLAFSRSVADRLQNANLLAPESVLVVVSLLNPTIRLEAARFFATAISFDMIGQHDEGLRRVAAVRLIDLCVRSSEGDKALLKSIQNGVNAIVVR